MTKPVSHIEATHPETSLYALLNAIDQETAQARFLEQALLRERSQQLVRKKETFISFMVGDLEMALSIDSLQEIGNLPTITPLPFLPQWIHGIVQIRGEILSVVDIPLFCGSERLPPSWRWAYLLFKHNDLKFCLIASSITGVISIDKQRGDLQPLSVEDKPITQELASFIKGVFAHNQREVCIMDHEKLATSPSLRQWRQI